MGEISPPPRPACTSSPSGDGRAREVEDIASSRLSWPHPRSRPKSAGLLWRRGSRITLPLLRRKWHETIATGRVSQLQLVLFIDRVSAPDTADHGHCGGSPPRII